jgi:hypothetical protein
MIRIKNEDGISEWVSPGDLKRSWSEALRIRAITTLCQETLRSNTALMTDEYRGYWSHTIKVFDQSGKKCANPLEAWYLNLLTDLDIQWGYEPTSFTSPECGFRPDLYLPEIHMYVEISASLRRKARHKRTKLGMMSRHHPDVKVVVLYWEDAKQIDNHVHSKEDFYAYIKKSFDSASENQKLAGQKSVL